MSKILANDGISESGKIALEEKGFESLWIANANSYDALNLVLYLSTQTSTIELGRTFLAILDILHKFLKS